MNTTKIIITVAAILVVAFGAYAWFSPSDTTDTPEPEQQIEGEVRAYQSDDYSFSFEVPGDLEINEYNSMNISVGTNTEDGGFDSVADVSVIQNDRETTYDSFEDFLYARTSLLCAADGPGMSIDCTGVAEEEGFETNSGLAGAAFYLTEEVANLEAEEVTTSEKGPFYAFNISANDPNETFTALVVHAPISLPAGEIDEEIIQAIAESVQVNRVENR